MAEIMIAIALLCHVSIGESYLTTASHHQLRCQKNLTKCVKSGKSLDDCILKK